MTSSNDASDDQYMAIGRIAVAWTHVENMYEDAIWGFANLTKVTGLAITTHMSTKSKIDALVSYVDHSRPELLGELKELVKRTESYRIERNNIIHSTWVDGGTYNFSARRKIKHNSKTYSMDEMIEIHDQIMTLMADIFYFLRENKLLPIHAYSDKSESQ